MERYGMRHLVMYESRQARCQVTCIRAPRESTVHPLTYALRWSGQERSTLASLTEGGNSDMRVPRQ